MQDELVTVFRAANPWCYVQCKEHKTEGFLPSCSSGGCIVVDDGEWGAIGRFLSDLIFNHLVPVPQNHCLPSQAVSRFAW